MMAVYIMNNKIGCVNQLVLREKSDPADFGDVKKLLLNAKKMLLDEVFCLSALLYRLSISKCVNVDGELKGEVSKMSHTRIGNFHLKLLLVPR